MSVKCQNSDESVCQCLARDFTTNSTHAGRLQLPHLSNFYLQCGGDKLVMMFRDRDFGQTPYPIHLQGDFKGQYKPSHCVTTLRADLPLRTEGTSWLLTYCITAALPANLFRRAPLDVPTRNSG